MFPCFFFCVSFVFSLSKYLVSELLACVSRACRFYCRTVALPTFHTALQCSGSISVWWVCEHRACISIDRMKNRRGHLMCCMLTGRNNGLMQTTHTCVYWSLACTSSIIHQRTQADDNYKYPAARVPCDSCFILYEG